MLILVLSKTNK